MLGLLLFGPRRRGNPLSGVYVRPRQLTIDVLREVLRLAQEGLADSEVTLFTFKWTGNRAISPDELRDLTPEERRGLVLRASHPGPAQAFPAALSPTTMQIPLGQVEDAPARVPMGGEHETRILEAALAMIERDARPIVQWKRLLLLALPLIWLGAVAAWIVSVSMSALSLPTALAVFLCLVVLGVLVGAFVHELRTRFDAEVVPHRFQPISYADLLAERANTRKNVKSAAIGAAFTAVGAVVLWLLGIGR